MGPSNKKPLKLLVSGLVLIAIIFLGIIWIHSSHTMIQNPRLARDSLGPWAWDDVNNSSKYSIATKLFGYPTFHNDSTETSTWVIQLYSQIEDGLKMHQRVQYFVYITANYTSNSSTNFAAIPDSYLSVSNDINLVYAPSNVKYSLNTKQSVVGEYTKVAYVNSEQHNFDTNRIDQRLELVMHLNDPVINDWFYGVCSEGTCTVIQTLRVKVVVKYYEALPLLNWGDPKIFEFILGDGTPSGDMIAFYLYPI